MFLYFQITLPLNDVRRELLKSRENYLYEESNTRMRNIINSVNQLQAAYQSNHPKRLCPDDSEVSSDEDISDTENDGKDYSSVNENRRQEVRDCCSGRYIFTIIIIIVIYLLFIRILCNLSFSFC
ncbi:unnamed protein product [Trichobilharzia regenti]|nr:unnamed protein product [Trichobilharzia regenti]